MYAQITTLCNMECVHCCFSCGPKKPFQHMSWDVYISTIEVAEELGDYFHLGGGEPTCHPEFWRYLREAVRSRIEGVWMATNGKRKKYALALAKLSSSWDEWYEFFSGEEGYEVEDPWTEGTCFEDWEGFTCALSLDRFHAPISQEVERAFNLRNLERRDVGGGVINVGAARLNELGGSERCACSDTFVAPDGTVKVCGCPESLVLGNIQDSSIVDRLQRVAGFRDTHNGCGYFGFNDGSEEDFVWNHDMIDYILEDAHGFVFST